MSIPALPSFAPKQHDFDTGVVPSRGDPDLYESWRAVFDRAQPTQMSDEDDPACDQDGCEADEAANARREPQTTVPVSCAASTSMSSVFSSTSQPALALNASLNSAMTSQGKPSVRPCVIADEARLAIGTQAGQNANVSLPMQPRNSGAGVGSVIPTNPPALEPVPASDSISVFVHGEAVSIVVRDLALSDQQAIETALAAARDLTGRADALRLLTLNGRTLYRQTGVFGMQLPSCPATLAFTC